MTRSLDYARATVQRFPGPPLGDAASLDAWFAHAREAFVHAWREAAAGARGRLAPDGDAEFHQALELFELEKALYETRYELNNRPDWVSIPLAAVLAIAAQGA
jgi:maltose alpha-D-glucosyltransferase/alpha-amylase